MMGKTTYFTELSKRNGNVDKRGDSDVYGWWGKWVVVHD